MQLYVIIFAILIKEFAAEYENPLQQNARPKRQAVQVLESCHKPIELRTVMEYTSKSVELENTANEIAAGKRSTVGHMKIFGTVIRITRQREVSKIRSDMLEVKRESLSSDNWSSVEQEFQTLETSIKSIVSRSVEIPSATEIFGEVGLSVGGGISIPFITDFKAEVSAKGGWKNSWGNTTTNVVAEEVTTTVPHQTVKVGPKKSVHMTWTFYSVEDTIEYLVDLELDADNSYTGFLEIVLQRNDNGFVTPVSFKRVRSCILLKNLSLPEDVFKSIGITVENGKYFIKDFPIEVKIQSYHGHFETEEEDLV